MKVGEFDQRVPVRANDELGELGRAFNQFAEELQRVYKLRKQMTADIAHELRTPLTVISGYLEGLREGVIPATGENFEVIYQEAQLLNGLVEDLRLLSLADAGELHLVYQPVRPRELLAGVAKSFSPMAESHSVDLTVAVHQDTKVAELDRDRMTQVLRNLVSNALRYTAENGPNRAVCRARTVINSYWRSATTEAAFPNMNWRTYLCAFTVSTARDILPTKPAVLAWQLPPRLSRPTVDESRRRAGPAAAPR